MKRFDIDAALEAVAGAKWERELTGGIDRNDVEILAGALLSWLDEDDAPRNGDVVKIVGNSRDLCEHGLAIGSYAVVEDESGSWGPDQILVSGVVVDSRFAWDGEAGSVQAQYVVASDVVVIARAEAVTS